jgi:hypothetical protein
VGHGKRHIETKTARRDAARGQGQSRGEERRFPVAACGGALGDGTAVVLEFEESGLLRF